MASSSFLPRLDRLFHPGWIALGFAYWLALVCALEPGNLAGASTPPPVLREVMRLLAAAALGAAATPAILALAGAGQAQRKPDGLARVLGVLGVAFALIVISCVLAAWLLEQRLAPNLADIRQQLAANFVLLVFGLSAFLGFVCLARSAQGAVPSDPPVPYTDRLVFAERGQALIIQLKDIEWVESQGNYQAVRARGVTHLVRRTLDDLEAELPSERFVRIHRRAIVSIGFVQAASALSNGDAVVVMAGGHRLRLSRGRRAGLAAALSAVRPRNTVDAAVS
jgi:hypothetical protein